MKRLRFYELTRNAQDRFISATQGRSVPQPLLSCRVGPGFPVVWAGVSVAGLVCFGALLAWGFGELSSPVALAPPGQLAAAGVALVVAVFSGIQCAARFVEARRLQFARGRYLFPSGLVDATSYEFRVHPSTELIQLEPAGAAAVQLTFQGGQRFTLPLPDGASLGEVQRAVESAKASLEAAQRDQNLQLEASLDPLSEPRFSNPLAPRSAHRPPTPPWRKLSLPIAVVVGGLVGLGAGLLRNEHSERRLYAAARSADSVEAYRAYLARGGLRTDVPSLLLPNAELRQVVERKSLEELERYARENASSAIKPAIDLALRSALLAALLEAKTENTMTALGEFEQRHREFVPLVGPELELARLELTKALGERFLTGHAADSEALGPFVRALMRHRASNPPTVLVRFQRVVPDSVARADEIVQRDRFFAKVMLPSQYFDAERSKEREQRIFGQLAKRFEAAFPKDALELVHGEPLGPGEALPERVDTPTLFLSHATNMGGGIPNQKPNGTFVGIGFVFKGRFSLPGRATPLEMKYSIWRLPDLLKLRKGRLSVSQVYTTMADEAFGGFEQRVLGWLFRESASVAAE